MKTVLQSGALLLLVLILVHKSSTCSTLPCVNSSTADKVSFLTHTNFTPESPRASSGKLGALAETMANMIKDTSAQNAQRIHGGTSNLVKDIKNTQDVAETLTFSAPSSSLPLRGLKTADSILATLLGSQAASKKGVLATTLLAKFVKAYVENKSFSNANRRISKRSDWSYLDFEGIILFVLGLGIGSMMGLISVLFPLGLYAGYGGGYGTIPINTQVTGRKRREASRTSEVILQKIRNTLVRALEKFAENKN